MFNPMFIAAVVYLVVVVLLCGTNITKHNPRKGYDDTLIHIRRGMKKW